MERTCVHKYTPEWIFFFLDLFGVEQPDKMENNDVFMQLYLSCLLTDAC